MELTPKKDQGWIDKEVDPVVKEIKRKIIKNVKYVSAPEFKKKLSATTSIAFQDIPMRLHHNFGSYASFFEMIGFSPN